MDQPEEKVKARSHTTTDRISNLFDFLQVEEPADGVASQEGAPSAYAAPSTPSVKLEREDNDTAFELWCFLQDLNDVRTSVQETWVEYSKGQVSFLLASSVTDIAFGLLRCADAEFSAITKLGSTEWYDILQYFGLMWFARGSTVWLCTKIPSDEAPVINRQNGPNAHVVDLLCPVAAVCLLFYSSDASALCGKQKRPKDLPVSRHPIHHFDRVLQELAPQLHDLAHTSHCHICTLDEFVQGLVEVHTKGKFPMWLVVACQIYLDIYDLLGDSTQNGADALQEALQRNREIRTAGIDFDSRQMGGLDCHYTFQGALEWLARPLRPFEDDQCSTEDTRSAGLSADAKATSGTPSMERSLPAHAGAVLMELELNMHKSATALANHGCVVLAVAHVYKELRATGALEVQWHDMEFVLTAFGVPQLFPAAKWQDPRLGAIRRLNINLGSQPGGLPRQSHRKKAAVKSAVERMRTLHVISPLLQNMSDRSKWDKMGHAHSKSKMVEIALHSLTPSEKKAENANRKASGNQLRATECTPSQLLATFKRTILSQEPMLNFDFIGFMISCTMLLYKIYNESWFRRHLEKSTYAKSHPLVAVPHALLEDLEAPVIPKAADMLAAHIDAHSKDFLKPAYARSSGRIPKDARPAMHGNAGNPDDLAVRDEARRVVSTVFDHAGAVYSFSCDSMAAYHPGVRMEACERGCGAGAACGEVSGLQTDPTACKDGPRIVRFGAALPTCILEAAVAQGEDLHDLQTEDSRHMGLLLKYMTGMWKVTTEEDKAFVEALGAGAWPRLLEHFVR